MGVHQLLDIYCSKPHYIDHIAPVWKALPEKYRARFQVVKGLEGYAKAHGIDAHDYEPTDNHVLILSRADYPTVASRRIVYMEHGAGQPYDGRSYMADSRRTSSILRSVELVLTTPACEDAHRSLFGDRVKAIGSPKLDTLPTGGTKRGRKVVAISHHWDQSQYPETKSAWPWDKEAIEALVESKRYRVIGHKHPADRRPIEQWWRDIGVEFVADFNDVLKRADIYVCDNSSTLYEFAATDRPVVCLSPPWYRRDIEHGMRFWSHMPGIDCAHPSHLEACIAEALADTEPRKALRHAAVKACYGEAGATQRAVEVLTEFLDAGGNKQPPDREKKYRLGVSVEFNGVTYPRGSRVTRDEALAMKEAGVIQGRGI